MILALTRLASRGEIVGVMRIWRGISHSDFLIVVHWVATLRYVVSEALVLDP